jgi:hypothetical protein
MRMADLDIDSSRNARLVVGLVHHRKGTGDLATTASATNPTLCASVLDTKRCVATLLMKTIMMVKQARTEDARSELA